VSRTITALRDDGKWVPLRVWRAHIAVAVRDKLKSGADVKRVTELLRERNLVEQEKGRVRRVARHFVATTLAERRILAMEFSAIVALKRCWVSSRVDIVVPEIEVVIP
jgi:hypothetical protein